MPEKVGKEIFASQLASMRPEDRQDLIRSLKSGTELDLLNAGGVLSFVCRAPGTQGVADQESIADRLLAMDPEKKMELSLLLENLDPENQEPLIMFLITLHQSFTA